MNGHPQQYAESLTDERADWLAWRRNGIGASDIAGILNLSPWASPFSVWASKVDDRTDDHDTPAMEFGRRAEVMIGPWFEERTAYVVNGAQQRCERDGWKFCTVDGMVHASPFDEEPLGVLEIKTTSDTAAEWAEHGVPVHYQCQATWAMHVTNTPRCWFAVLHLAFGRPQFEVYEFARDEADEQFVVEAVTEFWHTHVLTGLPPDTDAHQATTDAIKAHWPTAEGSIDATPDLRRIVGTLRDLKAQAAIYADAITGYENHIRAALGDKEALIDGERVIASWKPQDARRLNTAALKAAHPELVEQFTTTTTSRVLRLPKPKE